VPFVAIGHLRLGRYAKRLSIGIIGIVRALTAFTAAAAAATSAPVIIVYVVVAVNAACGFLYIPATAGLSGRLCDTPQEGASLTVVKRYLTRASVTLGSLLSLTLIGGFGTASALIVAGLFAGASAFFISRLKHEVVFKTRSAKEKLRKELASGFSALVRFRGFGFLTAIDATNTFIIRATQTFIIVLSFNVFFLGQSGQSAFMSAIEFASLFGVVLFSTLIPRHLGRLTFWGILTRGAPLLLCAIFYSKGAALVLLAITGLGGSMFENSIYPLGGRYGWSKKLDKFQSAAVTTVIVMLAAALGGYAAVFMDQHFGVRNSLFFVGGFSIVFSLICLWPLLKLEKQLVVQRDKLAILQQVPMFRPLPLTEIENLLNFMNPASAKAGEAIITQGETGDNFYVITKGEVEVTKDGVVLALLRDGDEFGEIALLEDVPRTATVKAVTDVELLALNKWYFMTAVSGNSDVQAEAKGLSSARLDAQQELGLSDV
jgi:hypothetical protein